MPPAPVLTVPEAAPVCVKLPVILSDPVPVREMSEEPEAQDRPPAVTVILPVPEEVISPEPLSVIPPALTIKDPVPLEVTVEVPLRESPPVVTVRFPSVMLKAPFTLAVRAVPEVTEPVPEAVTEPPALTVIDPEVEKRPPLAIVTGLVIVVLAAWKSKPATAREPDVKVSDWTSVVAVAAVTVTSAFIRRSLRPVEPMLRLEGPVDIVMVEVPRVTVPAVLTMRSPLAVIMLEPKFMFELPLAVKAEFTVKVLDPKLMEPVPLAVSVEMPVIVFAPRLIVPELTAIEPERARAPLSSVRVPPFTRMEAMLCEPAVEPVCIMEPPVT